jgi:prepilin-type N-terminal cleavage/methylation domain-containing protein
MSSPFPPLLTPSAEQGFTLVELLVAMLISTVVIAALVAILTFSLGQETRITDKVQADQIGRTAMTNIIDELHSSCTGFGANAIQGPSETPTSPLASSGATNLWFVSAYGNEDSGEALIEKVTEHDINWTASTKSNTGEELGTLTDYSFESTSGNAKAGWTFPSLTVAKAKIKVLAKNVIPPEIEISGKKTPTIFQYYKYENTASSETDGELVALSSSEVPTAAKEGNVAKATVSFAQAPAGGDTRTNRSASFSNSVILRFTPSETGAEVKNEPCE